MVEVSDESLTEPNKLSKEEALKKDAKETIIEVEITDEMNCPEQPPVKKHVCESINITLTKLRPEAPPFLPEKIMTLMKGHQEVVADLIIDSPIDQKEECYFTDVNLPQSGQIANENDIDIQHLREPDKKEIGLKPFSLVSNVSRSTRKSQASEIENKSAGKEGGSGASPPGPLAATESRRLQSTIARYLQDNPKQVAVKIFISLTVIIVLLAFIILRLF